MSKIKKNTDFFKSKGDKERIINEKNILLSEIHLENKVTCQIRF